MGASEAILIDVSEFLLTFMGKEETISVANGK